MRFVRPRTERLFYSLESKFFFSFVVFLISFGFAVFSIPMKRCFQQIFIGLFMLK